MKKKLFVFLFSFVYVLFLTLAIAFSKMKYYDYRVKNAIIKVELIDDLSLSFGSAINVSDLIFDINGEIVNDYKIDTEKLGKQTIDFVFVNEERLKIPYSFSIEVVDDTPPLVWLSSVYTVNLNYSGNLAQNILCADDTDDYPVCEIIGNYNTKKVGNYKLIHRATDKYGNTKDTEFTLKVTKPTLSSSSSSSYYLPFSEAYEKYKTSDNKVGIDVSFWQGDINFQKVKDSGVEFAIIRIGSKNSQGYFLDSKFKQNIEGFNKVGIPVGIYFYAYTKSAEEAREDAKWILENIKGYKIDLPIAYDWENWSNYNQYHLSLFNLRNNAKIFMDEISNAGYDAMLYGSRNYLNSIWLNQGYPVWVAHYTEYTDYQNAMFWQFSASGRVDGIYGAVDLNIMYE